MSWRSSLTPTRMERVALVAPADRVRPMLVAIAKHGGVELALPTGSAETANEEFARAERAAVVSGPVAGYVGWTPAPRLPELSAGLDVIGAAAVPIAQPRGEQPPTQLAGPKRPTARRILVDTYGVVPYDDVDPGWLAAASYVLMFGIMFGDVGHGLVLALAGVAVAAGWIKPMRRYRRLGGFIIAAGVVAALVGLLYGEFFGPTGVVPTLWLDPLAQPITLMVVGMLVGAALLAISMVVGAINRVREGGWGFALYSRSGIAGILLYLAVAFAAGGVTFGAVALDIAAGAVGLLALAAIFVGLYVESGGGGMGVMQAAIELVDTVIRLGSNLISFARLAAFGLTHAALTMVVWQGTSGLWHADWRAPLAILLFLVGNAVTFGLELLVAGIQALRLEYYELFSRILLGEGRAFRPWAPALPMEETGAETGSAVGTATAQTATEPIAPEGAIP
ncbi:V-type ATPase 116kDa subunit family protein [Gryllotalpicola sp.]|uniref:V-type ATPase 116kDa subunit family protein n=1 Tax=Gryllotalpicola sp. TaxID=1932787 RepID=UPI0026244644|nr:V-type ATPase 116kDa subunit family protein [Gryllotalpicola sp.]